MSAPRLIAGRYRVDRRLGTGGMSTVQLALDERLERHVAIKLLAEHLADDPQFVARFQREALAAAQLVHPNVVQVYDSGFDAESHRHYIVMEYVAGRSCAEILRDEGPLPAEEVVDIVGQACRGLGYAHRHGVVHRDVKPGNLLRSEDGTIKLADFGIARAADQSSITQAGSVLGTAAYLAPEQARGEEAGPTADLYALGVVSYQLLTGQLPYDAASLSELLLKQQSQGPERLEHVNPEVPVPLAHAVERAIALDPAERYASAPEMAAALREAAHGVDPGPPTGATGATAIVGGGVTGRTRLQPASEPLTPAGPRPLETVPAKRRNPPRRPAPAPARAPRRRRGALRIFLLLALLVVVAAAIGVGIAASTRGGSGGVQLNKTTYHDVQHTVQALQQIISDNTR